MPVSYHWFDDERTIIYFTFEKPWTLDEFFQANSEASAVTDQIRHMVDAIFDVSQVSILPKDALSSFISATKHSHAQPNQGITVVLKGTLFVRRLAEIIAKLAPNSGMIRLATDLDDALRIIAQVQEERRRG